MIIDLVVEPSSSTKHTILIPSGEKLLDSSSQFAWKAEIIESGFYEVLITLQSVEEVTYQLGVSVTR